jgi:hypothetical protein
MLFAMIFDNKSMLFVSECGECERELIANILPLDYKCFKQETGPWLWIRLTSNTVGFDGKFDISKRFEIQPWHV